MAKRAARSQRLPGVESGIAPLEELAVAYAEVRDRRAALTREEVSLKQQAMALMHKYDKTVYKHDGIEIVLEPGEESIKVKVAKHADEDGENDGTD